MMRLLLPFTSDIDARAIQHALLLARQANATLVTLSLLPAQSVRAGRIEQSKDFLEYVRFHAAQQHIPFEQLECSTHCASQSISLLADELCCDTILLFMRDYRGVLLSSSEIQQLLNLDLPSLFLARLAPKKSLHTVLEDVLSLYRQPTALRFFTGKSKDVLPTPAHFDSMTKV